jgi:radical SAM protein with 4Fe4S-binding SPASM domain
MKATLPLTSMGSLYASWKDHEKLHNAMKADNLSVTYSPTIDYVSEIPDAELPQMIDSFRNGMLRIAAEEIKFHEENGYFLCTWFGADDSKVHCASGVHMHAIDVDGNSYACHGSLYSPNKEQMRGGHIDDDSFINNVIDMSNSYSKPIRDVSDICKDCVATTCMICPVVSLDNSKKEDYFDKWTDRWVNNMCGFFKAFGEIDRTVQAHLDKEI